jgi:hypothetical protein
MVAVMIVALALWVRAMHERRAYCQRRAAYWAGRERKALKWATELGADPHEKWRSWAAVERESAALYGRLRVKYEIGAANPWSPVIPDPAEFRGRVFAEVGFIAEGLEGE